MNPMFLPPEATHPLGPAFDTFASADFGVLPADALTFGWWTRPSRPEPLVCGRCGQSWVEVDADFNVVLGDPRSAARPVCAVCTCEAALDLAEFVTVYQDAREAGHAWTLRVAWCVPLVLLEDLSGTVHTILLRRDDVAAFVGQERERFRREHAG